MPSSFRQRLQAVNPEFETFESLQTLQVNLGNLCNLSCTHCHQHASRHGTAVMAREVMDQIAGFLTGRPAITLDITGGCPEMNPHFRYLIEQTEGVVSRRMLRSNLTIMAEPGREWLADFCRRQGLTIIGSLPCYLEENVDRHRGTGVYQKSIRVLKHLNTLGYGTDLELHLVYNPGGAWVPGSQRGLEEAYRTELWSRHGITFNHLFTITNAPIGRFGEQLEANGGHADYLSLLAGSFNPEAAGTIMCRTLVSVDWQGKLYNCDFNQALGMPITAGDGSEMFIAELDAGELTGKKIRFSRHCFCCTAGEGSSCTGALVP